MFITKLYQHSKAMFVCFTAFILMFLFVNYKWGVVATPVLQYGMYSGQYHLADTITFYSIMVNGQTLDPDLLSQGENDRMQSYIDQYNTYKETNEVAYYTMSKYLDKLGLTSFAKYQKYNPIAPLPEHYMWLKNKIQQTVREPMQEFSAARQQFTWSGNLLQPSGTPVKINFVAAK